MVTTMSNKSKVFFIRAFFVVVVVVIAISLFLPVYRKDFNPVTAKAVDDNETNYGNEFNFINVTLPVQYSFTGIGSYSPKYVTGPLRFVVYNTTSNTSGSVFTIDYVYTFGNSNGNISSFLLNSPSISPWFWYVPAQGTTMSGSGYASGPALTITKEVSDNITGTLKSFTTGLSTDLTDRENGFYVTFTFEGGYKKYTFTTNNNWIVLSHGQTVPLTTTIATISADGVASYNEGYNAGKIDGYNNGYTDGENAGKGVGYNKGYTAGYNEGREAPEYSFKEFFLGLGDSFVAIWSGMLNFEFLGVNIAGLIGTILVVCLVFFIVKIVKGV